METEGCESEEGVIMVERGAESRGGSLELGRRLLAAARDGDCEAVLDLMSRGAPFTTDWLGTSALHAAAARGQAGTAALLLRAGALRDARSKVDRTPLHVAAHAGHHDVCALLLLHGAQVDCRDMLGMTPLAWAVERSCARAAALLLARGADPDLRSRFRTSPRDLARRAGRDQFLEMIEKTTKERADNPTGAADTTTKKENDLQKEYVIISDRLNSATKVPEHPQKTLTNQDTSNQAGLGGGGSGAGGGGAGAGGGGAAAAARLLRSHGITLLPPDTGGTVLSALRAGRTVLLSDAGKLMLKESSQVSIAATGGAPGADPAGTAVGAGGRSIPRITTNITLKKFVNSNNKVKYVALPTPLSQAPRGPPAAPTPPRLAPGPAPAPTFRTLRPLVRAPGPPRPLQAKQFVLADTTISSASAGAISSPKAGGAAPGVVRVPAEFLTSLSPEYLRAQLLAAHAELAGARAQLAAERARAGHLAARLARHEQGQ